MDSAFVKDRDASNRIDHTEWHRCPLRLRLRFEYWL
jgi:hypothetical protein